MARLRFVMVALLALALAGSSHQTGRSEVRDLSPVSTKSPNCVSMPTSVDERSCVIYSLTDLGYDADLGRWIAQAIPDIVESKSWQQNGGSGVLRYYAPKNILIVNHTATMQTKVDGFLKNLKTSLPRSSQTKLAKGKKSAQAGVVPAAYQAPEVVRTPSPQPEPSSYPVPAPVKAPKHLFHFLIRYEGEGIIDDNVVKFMKGYMQAAEGASNTKASQPAVAGASCPASSAGPIAAYSSAPPAATAVPAEQPKQKDEPKDEPKEKPSQYSR